jgi:hypothetical protein
MHREAVPPEQDASARSIGNAKARLVPARDLSTKGAAK